MSAAVAASAGEPNDGFLPGVTYLKAWTTNRTTAKEPQTYVGWPLAPAGIPWVEPPQSPVSPLTFSLPAPPSRYEFDQLKHEVDQLKARLAEREALPVPLRAEDV